MVEREVVIKRLAFMKEYYRDLHEVNNKFILATIFFR